MVEIKNKMEKKSETKWRRSSVQNSKNGKTK